jgi:penicillin-binding protein 1A
MAMVGRRQVGSTIKPYLYALAMENGFSPCDEVRNVEQTLFDENGKAWSPRNSSKSHYGEIVTLKWGLANSNNWISAYLMSKLSPYDLVRLIHSFGVLNKDVQPTVSLCLGPCEISVGEMVSAYTAFVNKGIRTAPLFVTRIEDNDGNVVANFTPQVNEVISESTSYKMLVMLRAVINEGTGGRVRRCMVLRPTWEVRQEQRTVTLMDGSWALLRHWYLVAGLEVKNETFTLIQCVTGKGPLWHCLSGGSICRKFMLTKR